MTGRDGREEQTAACRRQAEELLRKKAALSPENHGTLLPEETLRLLHELQVHQVELEMQNEELRQAQVELEDSRARYFDLYDLAPAGYLTLSDKGLILEANLTAAKLLNAPRSVLLMQPLSRFVLPEDHDLYYQHLMKILRAGDLDTCELRLASQDSRIFWAQVDSVVAQNPDQASVCRVVLTDISGRKKTEESLRASEKMLQTIIETEPECVKLLDGNSRLLMMNRAGLEMIQADSLEQVKGQCVRPLISPEYQQAFGELTSRVFQGGTGTLVFEIIGLKGRRLWLETHAVPLRNEKNEIFALLGMTRDITERRRAEEKLLKSEEFIRNILNTVDEGFIVVDRSYRILTANKAYCSQVGGSEQTILGRHCYEVSHKVERPCYEEGEDCAVRRAFETGSPQTALHRHRDAEGKLLYAETKAFPIKDAAGTVTSVIKVIDNITGKYLLEEERLKTQKLESIGTLAGGIAHDFNNLLQGVFGYISMAKLTFHQPSRSLAMLEQAEEALHQSVNLTNQLLTFSKGGKPVKKLMRLEATIENAVRFALSGSNTDYRLLLAPGLWSVEADEGQLGQVIQNIVLNANQSMAERGTITIALSNRNIAPQTHPRLPEGGQFVCIDIADTGIGISEQNIAKIFDPYFTTKQKGSGLGLATSYSIIRNHGGLIEVKSELNQGSTFSIYLPASHAAEPAAEQTAPTPLTTRKIRVLLMDDEAVVRNVATEMIAALGHDVEGAEDGRRAIELFKKARESGRPFDLIILDLTVKGGMGGEEAIACIRSIAPEVKAVVSSGYADNPVVADYRTYGFSAVLSKPYRFDDLKDCLNNLALQGFLWVHVELPAEEQYSDSIVLKVSEASCC